MDEAVPGDHPLPGNLRRAFDGDGRRLAPGEDLRTGFTMQMVDEFRHSTIQMNLKKWYMENYIDPAGFDITEEAFGKCYATTIGRQFGEGFLTGDAMTAACMYLTVVAETAFTNTLFVAMPSEAARNGDYALPTVFLSVQSDESRHIGNGHSLMMAALKEPENHLLIERDMKYAFWQNHAIVDAAIGTFIEYGTTDRDKNKESYAEMWHRWVYEDYYRTYMLPMEKYGIKIHHDDVTAAWERITKKNYVHKVGQFFAVGWPVNFWRIEAQTEKDFEWFEHKYPGWYAEFGEFWKWYAKLSQARPEGHHLQRGSRLRLSAPLLVVPGALPDPRGHGGRTRSTASCTPSPMKSTAGPRSRPLPTNIRAVRRLRWAASAASANGRRCITAWIWPMRSSI